MSDNGLDRELTGHTVWRDGVCYLIMRLKVGATHATLVPMDGGSEETVSWNVLRKRA